MLYSFYQRTIHKAVGEIKFGTLNSLLGNLKLPTPHLFKHLTKLKVVLKKKRQKRKISDTEKVLNLIGITKISAPEAVLRLTLTI